MSPSADVDGEALLCALVLAPLTFARNRFFALFTEPWARRIRSRAAQLRTIVRHFAGQQARVQVRDMVFRDEGSVVLRYGVPHLALERTAMLDSLEIAVIRFALSRRPRASSDAIPESMRLTGPAPEAFRSTLTPGDS